MKEEVCHGSGTSNAFEHFNDEEIGKKGFPPCAIHDIFNVIN